MVSARPDTDARARQFQQAGTPPRRSAARQAKHPPARHAIISGISLLASLLLGIAYFPEVSLYARSGLRANFGPFSYVDNQSRSQTVSRLISAG
jgi:hypothetical protein